VTVCGNADQEPCPLFPGDFLRIHWGLPDPAALPASAAAEAFRRTYDVVRARVETLAALPLESLDRDGLAAALRRIEARHPAFALPAAPA
jgi:arsenate reductase